MNLSSYWLDMIMAGEWGEDVTNITITKRSYEFVSCLVMSWVIDVMSGSWERYTFLYFYFAALQIDNYIWHQRRALFKRSDDDYHTMRSALRCFTQLSTVQTGWGACMTRHTHHSHIDSSISPIFPLKAEVFCFIKFIRFIYLYTAT